MDPIAIDKVIDKMSKENNESLVYSVTEAGKLLGLSRGSAYEAVKNGQIPSVKIGSRILVPKKALEKLLETAIINDIKL